MICSVEGCTRTPRCKGLCSAHYQRFMSTGSAHPEKPVRVLHGHAIGKTSPTYDSWRAMLSRCSQPSNKAYRYYGGRGVKVCDRWRHFANFLADMGERPTGLTIDRIDPHGDYEPGNCRWTTQAEQNRNQRRYIKAAA